MYRGLEWLCGVEWNATKEINPVTKMQKAPGVYDFAMQSRFPISVYQRIHPKSETFMAERWHKVADFLEIFSEKFESQIILRTLKYDQRRHCTGAHTGHPDPYPLE